MEKRKPHYDLARIKEFLSNTARRRITRVARLGAAELGYMDDDDMLEVINKLCAEHFYKSMPSIYNSGLWQDVYKFKDEDKKLYIKLQISIDQKQGVLIQFKKDEGDD